MSKFFTSKVVVGTLAVIIGIIVLAIVFEGGVAVGYRKALFSSQWGENYENNFAGPPHPFIGAHPEDMLNSNGTVGTVLSINAYTIIIKDNNNTEETVLASSTTVVRSAGQTITVTDIKPNDRVVVLGEPGATGQIEAKFIRVLNSTK